MSTSCFFHTTSITFSEMYHLSCQTCFSVPSTQYGVKRSLLFTEPTDHWFFPPFLSFHKATPNTVFSPAVLKQRRLEKVKGQTRQNLDSTLEISATMLKTETSETWDQREFLHAQEAHSNWWVTELGLQIQRVEHIILHCHPKLCLSAALNLDTDVAHSLLIKQKEVPTILPLCHQVPSHHHNQSHT